ncbi:xanthine dehydrogenase YagR molybdenum-binding subunit [Rhodococcus sp. OK519]|uniref:xanthine dehydrogenase family protein molybdopterin-binding subunit n=1 Tax=Rhodococcus sp. OK519 TaxID=2135729 RepID=UPI000D3753CA|nr:xanthine dehydrogenase YagR molybdenum-binding subunit [Rhodococcus sp. OK519]
MNAIGSSLPRIDGPAKVTGTAPYAYEHSVAAPVFLHAVTSTIARGSIVDIDTTAAEMSDGVLAVLTPWNAPRLTDTTDGEYCVLQDLTVGFRGQPIGAVIAETPEQARHAQSLVRVQYDVHTHDTTFRTDAAGMYLPDSANGGYDTTTEAGDPDGAFAEARTDGVTVDGWYTTPEEHNNPMEPHTTIALWDEAEQSLTLYDSTQGPHGVADTLAPVLGLSPEQIRVIAPHVGGGFGSKGAPHAHNVIAAMAAMTLPGRAVKFPVTRQQMFVFVGYRPPTASHIRIAANHDGGITALVHDAYSQSSHTKEFVEQTAVPSRSMYSAPHRRTSHRAVALDVPVPYWMRAPGEAPGMYAGEVAMDELAEACGIDPIELRVRNDPSVDPESGKPWASRRLVECLREGARRFGWGARRPAGSRREGDALVGFGVASAAYPHMINAGSKASIRLREDGRLGVQIDAVDIGTGTWTTLTLIAADALGCLPEQIALEIGDTALPYGTVAGGSSGTSSWGSAILAAAHKFRAEFGDDPLQGAEVTAESDTEPDDNYRIHSYGAHLIEARVDVHTGEITVPRMLGVFSIGRVVNPRTVRSQLLGGMTFGISMALHEESVRDGRFGHVVTQDLATYHFPTNADIRDMDAIWLDDIDQRATPMGSRGAGEIGNVGSAAAVVNAVCNATGIRVRELPIRADDLLPHLPDIREI